MNNVFCHLTYTYADILGSTKSQEKKKSSTYKMKSFLTKLALGVSSLLALVSMFTLKTIDSEKSSDTQIHKVRDASFQELRDHPHTSRLLDLLNGTNAGGDYWNDSDVRAVAMTMRNSLMFYVRDGVRYPALQYLDNDGRFYGLFHADPEHWDASDSERNALLRCPGEGVYQVSVCNLFQLEGSAWNMTRENKIVVIRYPWFDIASSTFIIKDALICRLSPNVLLWGGLSSTIHVDDPLVNLSYIALALMGTIFAGMFVYPGTLTYRLPPKYSHVSVLPCLWFLAMSSLNVHNLQTDYRTAQELDALRSESLTHIGYMLFAVVALTGQQSVACHCEELVASLRVGVLSSIIFAVTAVTFTLPFNDDRVLQHGRLNYASVRILFNAMAACVMHVSLVGIVVILQQENPTSEGKGRPSQRTRTRFPQMPIVEFG